MQGESAQGASHMASLVCRIGEGRSCSAASMCPRYLHGLQASTCTWAVASGHPSLGDLNILGKIAQAGQSKSNACRNLHRLIHREGMTVPVRISTVRVPVRKRRPTVQKLMVWYPIIYPSSWIEFLLKKHSYLLLGGWDLKTQAGEWQQLLNDFWIKYKAYNPSHVMNEAEAPPGHVTIPIYLHGDEGRGKYKLPIMVEAFQACISYKGTSYKNSSGHPFLFSIPYSDFNCRGPL